MTRKKHNVCNTFLCIYWLIHLNESSFSYCGEQGHRTTVYITKQSIMVHFFVFGECGRIRQHLENEIWERHIQAKDIPLRYNSHYMNLAFGACRLFLSIFMDEMNLNFKIIMVKAFVKSNFQLVKSYLRFYPTYMDLKVEKRELKTSTGKIGTCTTHP